MAASPSSEGPILDLQEKLMQLIKTRNPCTLLSLFILPLSACSPRTVENQPTDERPAERVTEVFPETAATADLPTPSPTATEWLADLPSVDVPDPNPGLANVVGRILWNEKPMEGLGLALCETIDPVDGCLGAAFDTRTDEQGVYLFTDVLPGEYELVVESLDFERWLYVTAGLESGSRKHTVTADSILRLPDQSIFRFNLTLVFPEENAVVSSGQPVLAWEAYPDAAFYRVFLRQENGDILLKGEKTGEPSLTPPLALKNCGYAWQVEAYNASETKIAEHDGYSLFRVADQPLSC
jgi:hypothetical protein